MRVGVLTTSYPRDDEDPAGAFVAGFARWLSRHAGDVEVLCAASSRPLFYRGGAPAALAGGGWWHAAAFSAALLASAAFHVRRWDAIVSHWLVPSAAVGAALAGRRPHLAIAHGSDARLLARLPGGVRFVRGLARRADLVYVARALRVDGAPGRVVPMGVDLDPLTVEKGARERARARLGIDGFCVLYLGRLIADKGADLAIAALPDGATLLVAGDGPERARLERDAGGRVRFLGEVRGARKRELLAAADVLIVPSRVDGAPTVVREAHAAGLPVVATRAGGLPELIADGVTGVLCEADAASLGRALVRLADDPSARRTLAEAGSRVSASYDWNVVGPILAKRFLDGAPTGEGTLTVTRI